MASFGVVERSVGRILSESSDVRLRLARLSLTALVMMTICAAFSIAAHETAMTLNSVNSDVRSNRDCRSVPDGPCLYHTFAPLKRVQAPPPGVFGTYNRTLFPLFIPSSAGENASYVASWLPSLKRFAFPFQDGLHVVNGLRAVAAVAALLTAITSMLFHLNLHVLNSLGGATTSRLRELQERFVHDKSSRCCSACSAVIVPWRGISTVRLLRRC
jgi:hypothetical protein